MKARPDAIVHQLTAIPDEIQPRRLARQFEQTNRLRIEATRNLIDAARRAGTNKILAQSIAFAYQPMDGPVKAEEDPLWNEPPAAVAPVLHAVLDLERQVKQAESGIVQRYSYFYGPGTAYARDGSIAHAVRQRQFPVVGNGAGTFSFIHVEDAAAATVAALDRGAAGVYNIVDDEPAPVCDWLPFYTGVLRAPTPRRVPKFLARLVIGRYGGPDDDRVARRVQRHGEGHLGMVAPLRIVARRVSCGTKMSPIGVARERDGCQSHRQHLLLLSDVHQPKDRRWTHPSGGTTGSSD